ncbi:MAG: S49 family peptidase [Thalassolituus sp.]|uniref:S49 family peptidase n=1 Tax=Thalassolituus sp. TaxID=2030822 RepID=UPI0035123AEF|nr:MAG: S49 family peptidase [Thalassolituus sp.]
MDNNGQQRPADNSKEWKLIEKALLSAQAEQRTARRWGIFFKLLTFTYLIVVLALLRVPGGADRHASVSGEHAAIIEVNGPIAADQEASADAIVGALREAFDNPDVLGVILRINSPGGSPVQSGYVYDEIKRLKAERPDVPVYAVIVDLGASGAYYIAAAADEIYADKASLVGSIGVIGSGFGFTGAMEKFGVERRLYTSGEHKAFLDPFSPQKEDEKAFWESVLKVTHNQFIDQVKAGRGDRLADDPELFSGLVWTGEQALEYGLIDGLGSSSYVARELLGTEELENYTFQPDPFQRLIERFGASFGQGVASFFSQQTVMLR